MIRAVETPEQFMLGRTTRYLFVMDSPQGERILCRDGVFNEPLSQGWWTWAEIYPDHAEGQRVDVDTPSVHTPYLITLDADMLTALTEALIIRATGTPMAAIAGIRKDLEHERKRRDLLEDTVIRIAEKRV